MITPAQRDRKNAKQRERIANQTEEEAAERKAKDLARYYDQTPEQRAAANERRRDREANETPEAREIRLAKKRAYYHAKKAEREAAAEGVESETAAG